MDIDNLSDKIIHTLKLPCKGDCSINVIKSLRVSTKKTLREKHNVKII